VLDFRTIEVLGPVNKAQRPRTIMASKICWSTPDAVARVVIDEKSGTIVMGRDVRIAQVANQPRRIDRSRARELGVVSRPVQVVGGQYSCDQRETPYLYRGDT